MTEQPTEPRAHGVHIDGQPGHARISIDGTPLPAGQVVGYTLEHDIANALPMLVLHAREAASVVWDGFARVAVATPQDPGEAVAGFLQGIDPAALERAALDRPDLDGGKHGVTAAILRQLADWAQGKDT
jgi:hypothetical protein